MHLVWTTGFEPVRSLRASGFQNRRSDQAELATVSVLIGGTNVLMWKILADNPHRAVVITMVEAEGIEPF